MLRIRILALIIIPFYSWAQATDSGNEYEIDVNLFSSNAKYPNGVGVSYSSGAQEIQQPKLGWRIQAKRIYRITPVVFSEPGISISYFSYLNEFRYPDNYVQPRTLSELFKYNYLSFDNRILFKTLNTPKLNIFPFVGVYLNVILKSEITRSQDANGQLVTDVSNLTQYESTVNFSYELGVKFVILKDKHHPIPLTVNYNHFFKEQFALGAGKINYAWGFSIGYML